MSRQNTSERLERLAGEGERFYTQRLRAVLEPGHVGRFVAIEPETGRYFLGMNGSEALTAAHEAMPDALFYLKRVGYEFAHRIGGHSMRLLEKE
jgi:hypothetical protein